MAMVAGLLLGLGSTELALQVGSMKEMLAALGFLELMLPLTNMIQYAYQTVMADPIHGLANVGYAIVGYMFYATFWSLGAMIGSMVERMAEEAGYMAGSALGALW